MIRCHTARSSASATTATARARVTEAREDLENAGITFRTLTGLPVDSVSMPPDLSQCQPATLEEAEVKRSIAAGAGEVDAAPPVRQAGVADDQVVRHPLNLRLCRWCMPG